MKSKRDVFQSESRAFLDPNHGEVSPPNQNFRLAAGNKLSAPSLSVVAAIASLFPARLNFTDLLTPPMRCIHVRLVKVHFSSRPTSALPSNAQCLWILSVLCTYGLFPHINKFAFCNLYFSKL